MMVMNDTMIEAMPGLLGSRTMTAAHRVSQSPSSAALKGKL